MLRDAIVSGTFPAGLRLPPERELATRFGVNRVTVRTALARIEAEHLVNVRQGSGYVVRDYRQHAGPDLIVTLAALATSSLDRLAIVRDLLVVRRHLARATLERLVEIVATHPRVLDPVAAAIDRFERAIKDEAPLAELAAADLAVVAELVTASRSAVLQLCFNPVAAILRDLPALQAAMYREPKTNVVAYRGLLTIVAHGRSDGIDDLLTLLRGRDDATIASLAAGEGARPTKNPGPTAKNPGPAAKNPSPSKASSKRKPS
ncbi:MAG: GntR family transcriptional regulator [Deltaproteobacteria bacterium]|nr:GntR family transcriptional regulator [Deltaproteobacteria bacterium]